MFQNEEVYDSKIVKNHFLKVRPNNFLKSKTTKTDQMC